MSKKTWRMHSSYDMMRSVVAYEPYKTNKANATLVPDDSCFPVREAMRFIAAYEATVTCNSFDTIANLGEARRKYLAAQARMKAKKGKVTK